jgi:AraC-like DNA-binding protein
MITSYSQSSASLSSQSAALSAFSTGLLDRTSRLGRPRRPAVHVSGTESPAAPPFVRYLPVLPDQSESHLCVLGMGRTNVQPGESYPNNSDHPKMYRLDWRAGRVLPEMQLLLLTGARGEFESRETGRLAIHNHAVVFLFPGVWHRYRPDRAHGWTERWISLNSWAAQCLIESGVVHPDRPVLVSDHMQQAVQAFDALAQHLYEQPVGQSAYLSQAASELVRLAAGNQGERAVACTEDSCRDDASPSDPIVEKAREIIWNHGHLRTVCVSEVAKQLPVTRRTLDRRFARTLGHSVLDEINSCRLWRAKRLLEETDLLIKTVAYLSGFPSRERMRLLFLGEEGLTPSEYRERVASTMKLSGVS